MRVGINRVTYLPWYYTSFKPPVFGRSSGFDLSIYVLGFHIWRREKMRPRQVMPDDSPEY